MVRTTPENSRTSDTVDIITAVCIRTGLLANPSISWVTPWYVPHRFRSDRTPFAHFYRFVPAQGGATIVKLQSLLSKGFFGNAYTPDMLLSLTTGKSPTHFRLSDLYSIYNNQ